MQIGNGYIGTFGVTAKGPDGQMTDRELPTIKAAAFMVATCYPGEAFINTVSSKLGQNSVAWSNNGGEDGGTAVPTVEEAGFALVRELILGKTPEKAAAAAQGAIDRSDNSQDKNGDSMVLIEPLDPQPR